MPPLTPYVPWHEENKTSLLLFSITRSGKYVAVTFKKYLQPSKTLVTEKVPQ